MFKFKFCDASLNTPRESRIPNKESHNNKWLCWPHQWKEKRRKYLIFKQKEAFQALQEANKALLSYGE